MASPIDRAWSEGFKAGKHGTPEGASPYKKGMLFQAWVQGWQNGVKARDDQSA